MSSSILNDLPWLLKWLDVLISLCEEETFEIVFLLFCHFKRELCERERAGVMLERMDFTSDVIWHLLAKQIQRWSNVVEIVWLLFWDRDEL